MANRFGWLFGTMVLSALVACGGDGGEDPPADTCTTHTECPARQYCGTSGTCVAEPTETSCHKPADCAATYTCESNVCTPPVTSCTTHEQCAAQYYCGPASSCIPETTPGTTCHKAADCSAAQTCESNLCTGTGTAECDKPANVAKRAAILAAQPTIEVGTATGHKVSRTGTAHFASVAGVPSVQCEVTITYKDLNNNSALDPYEDWTQDAATRADDLISKLSATERQALLLHPDVTDVPSATPSAAVNALVTAGVRFARTSGGNNTVLNTRAQWANAIQNAAEVTTLGVPFVLSSEPAHAPSPTLGRTKAMGWRQWPLELSMGAGSTGRVQSFGSMTAREYRSIGVSMVFGPNADLATDPRWPAAETTFGEDSVAVSAMVSAYVQGAQGTALGPNKVACVVGHYPGAGAAKDGKDARLPAGKFTVYPGNKMGDHLAPFQAAITAGVAGVMPGYAIPQTGAWTALGGTLNGSTLEQVGASFNATLIDTALRGNLAFTGLVVAPLGVLNDASLSPLGAPWGLESATQAERLAKAVNAGVDQFVGFSDATVVTGALGLATNPLTQARVDAAAKRALVVAFKLGLFEDPYVDHTKPTTIALEDATLNAAFETHDAGVVLLLNKDKPNVNRFGTGWLNGGSEAAPGDGHQTGDGGNAGNGSMKILPAPPGVPYQSVGCNWYLAGDFDLDYVRTVSSGYGAMTNDLSGIVRNPGWSTQYIIPVTTDVQRAGYADYVFVRIRTPSKLDVSSGALGLPDGTLEYADADDTTLLAPLAWARNAIDTVNDDAQLIVIVDGGRPSVLAEIMTYDPDGVFVEWGANMALEPTWQADKAVMDVAFGQATGNGKLPVGIPLSNAAAASQNPDQAGDGTDATFVKGFGLTMNRY